MRGGEGRGDEKPAGHLIGKHTGPLRVAGSLLVVVFV